MDPYLEDPHFWPGFQTCFVVYLTEQLQPLLRPRYIADIRERYYQENPLLRVRERHVAILDRQSRNDPITIITLVSPQSKLLEPARDSYLTMQQEVRRSSAHLLEIDLCRTGSHIVAVPEARIRKQRTYAYLVCENRAICDRQLFAVHPLTVRDALPRVHVPLAEGDPDVVVDLQAVFARVYENGCYQDCINYNAPCDPPLSREDQEWATQLIREAEQTELTPGNP